MEVTSIDPGLLCQERNATDLVLGGRGFTISLDRGKARCRFKTETGTVTAGMYVDNNVILQLPHL